MVELYEENGVQKEDAEIILNTMSKYKTFFLKHMVTRYAAFVSICQQTDRNTKGGRGLLSIVHDLPVAVAHMACTFLTWRL
jgi:hypothetical protein